MAVGATHERSEVVFGRTRIPYRVLRSARRRTVAVAVEPPGKVVLTAPPDTPMARLDEVVRRKAPWIVARLRLVEAVGPVLSTREFVSGETFLYLGRQYRLQVESGAAATAQLRHGRFHVAVTGRGSKRAQNVRAALTRWYRQHAAERVMDRVHHWSAKVGVEAPEVLIRSQEQRWASCVKGVVRVNWRVVQAPMRLVDYVLAHEVVHLVHADHGKAFWALLGRVMPDYELRRAELRRLGARLVW